MLQASEETAFDAEVTVRRTRYVSEGSGWAVIEATDPGGEAVVIVGPVAHLDEHERARVVGSWEHDRRYGPQVKAREAVPLPPAGADAVAGYLRRVKHIGPARARRLIDHYGADAALDAVDASPERAFANAGLRGRAVEEAARSWERIRVTRQLHLLLAPHGLAYLAPRIHDAYGDGAHRTVSEHPYELTSVFGVGFLIADRIAQSLGARAGTPGRSRAATLHLLGEAERSGSTCLPLTTLCSQLESLIGERVPASFLDELVAGGDLSREGDWIYRRATAELEAELAARVAELVIAPPSDKLGSASDQDHAGDRDELTDEQLSAVAGALQHRLSLITGGPGTGKTASIRTIASRASALGARVMLVAPTGRAAIRMTEASGIRATTVHSALGWIPGEGPTHDEQDPVSCDLLIVDETSMANLELLVMLLRAVGPKTHVVLVGDADQLAPVGAGKPFAELVEAGAVPVSRLTHIFRQAAGSMIVQAAHAIRRGEMPSFRGAEGMRRDLFLIARDDPASALSEIVSLVCRRMPDHYGVDPVRDIQVFVPVYRGELGIDSLNEALREQLNPHGVAVHSSRRLRIGDKLMMTGRNLHELGLMNGTLLRLVDEIGDEDDDPALLLKADDDTVFRLPAEQSDRLALAYACSVHRGQGIELPVAVIVAHPSAGAFFLRREMLYTAITRATIATVIVGTREVIARAARTPDTGRRHSRLGERLLENQSEGDVQPT